MKAQLTKSVLVLVIGLLLTNCIFAQNSLTGFTKNKYALENLLMGIHSDNEGVRKSAIYFAGKYKVEEAAQALIEQLNNEENASIKVLIALALFEMESKEGLDAVKKLSKNDDNLRVRNMATFIYNEYTNGHSLSNVKTR
jgi:HEAT repeat protein